MVNAVAARVSPRNRRWWWSPARPGAGERERGLLLHHQAKYAGLAVPRSIAEITCDQARLDDAGARAGRDRARAAQLPDPFAAGLPRDAARHGARALRAGGRAAPPPYDARGARGLRGRDPGAARAARSAGADGRRRGAPLSGSRTRSPSWRAGSACRWSPASWAAACWPTPTRRCSAPTWASPGEPEITRAGRGLGRAVAAGRDRVATPTSACPTSKIDLRRTIQALDRQRDHGLSHLSARFRSTALVDALLARVPRAGRTARRRASPQLSARAARPTPRRSRRRTSRARSTT